jgi:hypothetical protein
MMSETAPTLAIDFPQRLDLIQADLKAACWTR